VGYDFLRKLKNDPSRLVILGDGSQSKSYVYVEDVVSGVLHVHNTQSPNTEAFNISTEGYLTVREISLLAIAAMGISRDKIILEFGTENRGWKGDVPVVRLDYGKIRSTGWHPNRTSRDAMVDSLDAMRLELM
jgi:UDP-glucose 4-epimerase